MKATFKSKNLVSKFVFTVVLLLAANGLFAQVNGQTYELEDENYVTCYVETTDTARIEQFISEMKSYQNKVIDCYFDFDYHEMTVVYTDLMRDDTIYQILMRYFGEIKKVRGTFIE